MRVSISKVNDVEVRGGGVVEGQVGGSLIEAGRAWLTVFPMGKWRSDFALKTEHRTWSVSGKITLLPLW